jgi:hypothetical protein
MVDIHLKYVRITHVRKQPTDQWHGQITVGPLKATQGTETIKCPTDQWHGQITVDPVKATQGTETIKWCFRENHNKTYEQKN